jgi:hypothetical protein
LVLSGNPLSTVAPYKFFYDSFCSDSFLTLQIPSTSTPNYTGEGFVPGLATREWVEACAANSGGVESAAYKRRVLGEFVPESEGCLFSNQVLSRAVSCWESTPSAGRLIIGCDPAGGSGKGDSSAFVLRRGMKVVDAFTRIGLNEDGHLGEILGLCRLYANDGPPLVCIDRDGHVGARVYTHLSTYLQNHSEVFWLRGIRGGEAALAKTTYWKRRHELYFRLLEAMREGLAIPNNPRMLQELSVIKGELNSAGLSCIQSKDELRKVLGRSPDLADALSYTTAVPQHEHTWSR